VDISENDNSFILHAELPGLKKEEIKVTLQDNVLTVKGKQRTETKEENKNYHLCERRYGKFLRSFRLPSPVDNKKIEASFKDGLLTLTLPKAEEAKPKEIEIKMS
jgi:HSP20 family protein